MVLGTVWAHIWAHPIFEPLSNCVNLRFIETVFSSIKSLGSFEHHRHSSPINAFVHWISALISYQLRDDKPSLEKALNFIS